MPRLVECSLLHVDRVPAWYHEHLPLKGARAYPTRVVPPPWRRVSFTLLPCSMFRVFPSVPAVFELPFSACGHSFHFLSLKVQKPRNTPEQVEQPRLSGHFVFHPPTCVPEHHQNSCSMFRVVPPVPPVFKFCRA